MAKREEEEVEKKFINVRSPLNEMKLLAKSLIMAVAEVFQSADIQHHAQIR